MRYIRKNMNSQNLSKSNKHALLIICLGIFAGVLLKLFVIDFLHVSGISMEPAIKDKSVLAVNKLHYGLIKPWSNHLLVKWRKVQPGDAVIYLYNNKIVVKRCAAVSGQLLEYSAKPVYTLKTGDKVIPLTKLQYLNLCTVNQVPEGYILAVGDNYEHSIDSRDYGFVKEINVLGKVLCR